MNRLVIVLLCAVCLTLLPTTSCKGPSEEQEQLKSENKQEPAPTLEGEQDERHTTTEQGESSTSPPEPADTHENKVTTDQPSVIDKYLENYDRAASVLEKNIESPEAAIKELEAIVDSNQALKRELDLLMRDEAKLEALAIDMQQLRSKLTPKSRKLLRSMMAFATRNPQHEKRVKELIGKLSQ